MIIHIAAFVLSKHPCLLLRVNEYIDKASMSSKHVWKIVQLSPNDCLETGWYTVPITTKQYIIIVLFLYTSRLCSNSHPCPISSLFIVDCQEGVIQTDGYPEDYAHFIDKKWALINNGFNYLTTKFLDFMVGMICIVSPQVVYYYNRKRSDTEN